MTTSARIMTLTPAVPCEYYRWDDDLHIFCFSIPSRAAVDSWLSQLSTIYAQNTLHTPVTQLLDIRQSGMLPMTYVFNQLQTWIPRHQGNPTLYTAVLHNDPATVAIVQPFMRMLGVERDYKFRFFGGHAQENAIDWLLSQRVAVKVG